MPLTDKEYAAKLAAYKKSLQDLKSPHNTRKLIDKASNPDLYTVNSDGLVPKAVYQSNASPNAYFYEYEDPTAKPAAASTPAKTTPSKPAAPSTEGKYKIVTVKVISDDNPNASRGAKLKVPAGMFVPTTIRNKDFIKRYSGFENKYIESNSYYKQSSSDMNPM